MYIHTKVRYFQAKYKKTQLTGNQVIQIQATEEGTCLMTKIRNLSLAYWNFILSLINYPHKGRIWSHFTYWIMDSTHAFRFISMLAYEHFKIEKQAVHR